MKKITITILLFLISLLVKSQNHIYEYEGRYDLTRNIRYVNTSGKVKLKFITNNTDSISGLIIFEELINGWPTPNMYYMGGPFSGIINQDSIYINFIPKDLSDKCVELGLGNGKIFMIKANKTTDNVLIDGATYMNGKIANNFKLKKKTDYSSVNFTLDTNQYSGYTSIIYPLGLNDDNYTDHLLFDSWHTKDTSYVYKIAKGTIKSQIYIDYWLKFNKQSINLEAYPSAKYEFYLTQIDQKSFIECKNGTSKYLENGSIKEKPNSYVIMYDFKGLNELHLYAISCKYTPRDTVFNSTPAFRDYVKNNLDNPNFFDAPIILYRRIPKTEAELDPEFIKAKWASGQFVPKLESSWTSTSESSDLYYKNYFYDYSITHIDEDGVQTYLGSFRVRKFPYSCEWCSIDYDYYWIDSWGGYKSNGFDSPEEVVEYIISTLKKKGLY